MRSLIALFGIVACCLVLGCSEAEAPFIYPGGESTSKTSPASNEDTSMLAMDPSGEIMHGAGKIEIGPSSAGRDSDALPDVSLNKQMAAKSSEAILTLKDHKREGEAPKPTAERRKQRIQSRILTAGSLDDHTNFDEYLSYVSEVMQRDAGRQWRDFVIGHRVVVRVENEQGQGIGDARVKIEAIDGQANQQRGQSLASSIQLLSGSDGKMLFLPAIDSPKSGTQFRVTVTPAGGGEKKSQVCTLDETPWVITMPQAKANLPAQLDLALVIDTTGSMSDELEYLKVETDSIAAAVHERFPNVDQRYALILYRDEGDQYVSRTFDFTGSLDQFRSTLADQTANGGGDYPEAMHVALEQAGELSWRKTNTARVMFLVGDAPPHARFYERTAQAVKLLRRNDIAVFPVAASGVKDQAEFILRHAAFLTNGKYLFLTDHSGVGNAHAKPHTPQYSVERLVDLMIRMVASELAGRPLLPQDIIATEEGDPKHATPQINLQQSRIEHPTQIDWIETEPKAPAVAGLSWFDESFATVLRWIGFVAVLAGFLFLDRRF